MPKWRLVVLPITGLIAFYNMYKGSSTLLRMVGDEHSQNLLRSALSLDPPTTPLRSLSQPPHFPHRQEALLDAKGTNNSGDAEGLRPDFVDKDGIRLGVLSRQDLSFFRRLQEQVDDVSDEERCQKYGSVPRAAATTNSSVATHGRRRLFFGSLIAEEPWELLEIMATESYGLYHAMVLVESNRTQNLTPRRLKRTGHGPQLEELFGTPRVHIKTYVEENPHVNGLAREHAQRALILEGWKELGMQPHDVGILADLDETFARDVLRAAQVCDFPELDYAQHHCHHHRVKLIGQGRVFEASPECIHDKRRWLYPGMIVGQCLEHISQVSTTNNNETAFQSDEHVSLLDHPRAPRHSYHRQPGWGGQKCQKKEWSEEAKIKDGRYPLFNAADYRRLCAGGAHPRKQPGYEIYTAFHLHNFFASLADTRHKYHTYGHPSSKALTQNWTNMGNDNLLMYQCVMDLPDDDPNQRRHRIVGGLPASLPPWPLYFHDVEYRQRRHAYVRNMIETEHLNQTMK